jgi:predicted ATP-grasp superfamily ATP-dependent carboligase/glycosyltransferase involved in cell wall biosynthesis
VRVVPPHDGGALILGANYRGLGVARSLGRAGHEVWVALSDEHRVACASRYVRRTVPWPRADADRVARLLELAERDGLRGWVLFPTEDETALFLARHEAALAVAYRVGTSGLDATRVAYDKRETHRRAAALDLPQPWVAFPRDQEAVAALDCTFPVVVKPAVKTLDNRLTAAKAWRVADRAALLRAYADACALMPPDTVMVQEMIPGDGGAQLSFAALCRDGEVLAATSAVRLRQRPMDFGRASSYVETTAEGDAATYARRLLRDLHFTGLVEVEFKRDARDGVPKLLDVNARIWGWHTLCARAGVDFPALWYDLLHDRPVPRLVARPGVRWLRACTDTPTALGEIARGRLSWRDYRRSLQGPLEHAMLSADDPLPALVDVPILAWISGRRALRHRRAARRQAPSPPAPGVLILSENAPFPADRRLWNIARTLTAAGHTVTVVCAEASDEYPGLGRGSHELLDGIDIHRYPLRPAAGGVAGYAREYAQALWRIHRLVRRLARERRIDVVHVANPPDVLFLAALRLRARGARFVFDHHDLVPELVRARLGGGARTAPAYGVALALEQVAFRLAHVVISTNESYREIALGRGRKRPEDVFVVRNGPDLERFLPVPADPRLRAGREHLISYIGVMGPQDGIDHALRALAALRRRRGEDWRALLVGDGAVVGDMRKMASALGLDGLVEFTGWRFEDDIRRILSSSDVCLVPDPPTALNDRSTLVKIPEYLAMGRAVAAYDLTESRVSAGPAAVYARPGDPEDLGRCIDELLSDPERRAWMGTVGRARVASHLAWQHSVPSLLDAYARASWRAPARPLLDGHGLGQVARLVDVEPAVAGDPVGQHLQRDHGQ